MNWGEDASSIGEVVSNVAANAGASAVEGVALAADLNAHLVGIQDPVVRALEADVVVPVPTRASRVCCVVVSEGHAAGSVAEVVSAVAAQAVS